MSNTNISTYAETTDCGDSCWSTAAGTGAGCTGCDSLCTAKCESSCTTACENLCMDDCTITCTGTCKKTCTGECSNGCSGGCEDNCAQGCGTACNVGCATGCGGACEFACTGECGNGCGAGCGAACSWGCGTGCDGTCTGNCQYSCTGTSSSTEAILSLSGRRLNFNWELTNLTSPFDGSSIPFISEYVLSAGVTSDKFTVGDVSSISGVICQVSSGEELLGSRSYPAGTYTFYGFIQMAVNSLYYPAGSATVTINPDGTFSWTYAGVDVNTGVKILGNKKEQGLGIYIEANEWNDLVDYTNELTNSEISYVQPGDKISATIVNSVANALGITPVASKSPLKASFFNEIMDSIQSLQAL